VSRKPLLPRGFRDYPPSVMLTRLRVIESIRKIFQLHGFPPMDTPVVELWETLSGKYGEEAESLLIWRFQDPYSKRWYGLRYDLTVPLARYIAMHPETPLPFKRHQIALVWRHEEPQHMRYREFVQADVDVVGSPYPEADAEVLSAVQHALEYVGIPDVFVRLSHRKLLKAVFEKELGLANPTPVYRIIDKLDKIGVKGVEQELKRLGMSDATISRILRLIDTRAKGLDGVDALRTISSAAVVSAALNELKEIIELSYKPEKIVVDLSLVRGLDYYTGPIMEFQLEKESGPSLAGGGRYDDLIGLFRPQGSLPATGCSIGVERVLDVLLERGGTKPGVETTSKVLVVYLESELFKYAWSIAFKLRQHGIPAEIDLLRRAESKQRRRASSLNIPYVLIIGRHEASTGRFALYCRETKERLELGFEELVNFLKSVVQNGD